MHCNRITKTWSSVLFPEVYQYCTCMGVDSSDDKGFWGMWGMQQPIFYFLEARNTFLISNRRHFSYQEEVLAYLRFAMPVETCLLRGGLVGVAGASMHQCLWTVPSEQRKDPR